VLEILQQYLQTFPIELSNNPNVVVKFFDSSFTIDTRNMFVNGAFYFALNCMCVDGAWAFALCSHQV